MSTAATEAFRTAGFPVCGELAQRDQCQHVTRVSAKWALTDETFPLRRLIGGRRFEGPGRLAAAAKGRKREVAGIGRGRGGRMG